MQRSREKQRGEERSMPHPHPQPHRGRRDRRTTRWCGSAVIREHRGVPSSKRSSMKKSSAIGVMSSAVGGAVGSTVIGVAAVARTAVEGAVAGGAVAGGAVAGGAVAGGSTTPAAAWERTNESEVKPWRRRVTGQASRGKASCKQCSRIQPQGSNANAPRLARGRASRVVHAARGLRVNSSGQ